MTSLRLRMATPVVAGIALVGAVGWLMLERLSEESVSAASRDAVREAGSAFAHSLQASAERMSALLGTVARDRALTAALSARDHRRLLALAGPTYHALEARDGITHWNYWEPEAPGASGGPLRNVVRIGTPSMRGDFVERATLSRVSREQALVTGLELGYTGFVLRALAPVRDGDRLVGYVELGREIVSFLGEMKARTGDEYALLLDKRFVDHRRWASTRGARGERNDWADRDGVLLMRATSGDAAAAVPAALPDSVAAVPDTVLADEIPDEGRALDLVRHGGRVLARGAFPVRDASDQKVGAVLVVRDVTALWADVERTRRNAAAILGALLLSVALAIGAAFELLVVRKGRCPAAPVS